MVKVSTPGVYNLSAADYHADPCPQPSLSKSIAKVLIDRSPRHAWWAHPRLNPDFETETATKFDLGTAAHALLLGDEARFEIIDADSYRGKAAQEARDAAYAAGRTPLLVDQYEQVVAMARAARVQLTAHEEAADAFTAGKPEQTLVWCEGDIWCRARLDWLPDRGRIFDDYKTTSAAAHPDAWGARTFFDTGCDFQDAFYRRGIRAVLGITDPVFRFVVQETEPPHALCVMQADPAVRTIADKKVEAAIALWSRCLKADRWPGYPSRTCHLELPIWRETRWLEREERDASRPGADLIASMIDWQAPARRSAAE
jgi:hypothetical protein